MPRKTHLDLFSGIGLRRLRIGRMIVPQVAYQILLAMEDGA